MAAIEWPSEITYYIVKDSFQLIAPSRALDRTEFEDGPRRGRQTTTKNIATIGFNLSLPLAEFQAFLAFERDELFNGALPFEMPVWIAAGTYDVRTVRLAPGDGEPNYRVQSRGPFSIVSMVLDVEDWAAPAVEP